jgi:hypothetical protein
VIPKVNLKIWIHPPTILDAELQCPLLHHGLVHLYPREISAVYAACVELRETIERDWGPPGRDL